MRSNLRWNPTQPASPSFPRNQYFNTSREAGCICEPHPAAVHLELLPFQNGSEPTHLFTPEACASGLPPPRLPLFHPSTHESDTSRVSRRCGNYVWAVRLSSESVLEQLELCKRYMKLSMFGYICNFFTISVISQPARKMAHEELQAKVGTGVGVGERQCKFYREMKRCCVIFCSCITDPHLLCIFAQVIIRTGSWLSNSIWHITVSSFFVCVHHHLPWNHVSPSTPILLALKQIIEDWTKSHLPFILFFNLNNTYLWIQLSSWIHEQNFKTQLICYIRTVGAFN